jgi:maltose alpha-D-glucosyltransferase/alpha-amylase
LQWRQRDAILLAEANVPPDESLKYFGEQGDRLQMMLNFPVNQRLFYALATADIGPLVEALEQTAERPGCAQWVQFLRSHDELDLGRLTDEQRQCVFDAFGPEKHMQLYDRGIRRRLAPMLGNDRRKLELAFSLLFALPGTPMMQYGDEIGIGEDLSLPERECARTPMQWTAERHGGFSTAEEVVRPVIDDEEFGFQSVNVADQKRDTSSLLNWTERMIRARQECPEIGWGQYRIVPTSAPEVLAIHYESRGTALVTLHNFCDRSQLVEFKLPKAKAQPLVSVHHVERIQADDAGNHRVDLAPFGYKWFRVGSADTALDRTQF